MQRCRSSGRDCVLATRSCLGFDNLQSTAVCLLLAGGGSTDSMPRVVARCACVLYVRQGPCHGSWVRLACISDLTLALHAGGGRKPACTCTCACTITWFLLLCEQLLASRWGVSVEAPGQLPGCDMGRVLCVSRSPSCLPLCVCAFCSQPSLTGGCCGSCQGTPCVLLVYVLLPCVAAGVRF